MLECKKILGKKLVFSCFFLQFCYNVFRGENMLVNPYVTNINTQILKKLTPHGKFHVALKDKIELDYKKYRCFEEKFEINGDPVEKVYDSSLGKAYVISKNPYSNMVDLSVDYETRIKILKSFTCRYIITSALKKYFSLDANNFITNESSSSFFIMGLFDEEKIKEVIILLQRIISVYIESGLNVRTEKTEEGYICHIDGIYNGKFLYPHLSNLAEIGRFNVVHFELSQNGVTIHYNN